MEVFIHPSLLKRREEDVIIRENDLEVKKYLIDLQESQLIQRKKDIPIIASIAFIIGVAVGALLVFSMGV